MCLIFGIGAFLYFAKSQKSGTGSLVPKCKVHLNKALTSGEYKSGDQRNAFEYRHQMEPAKEIEPYSEFERKPVQFLPFPLL